MKQIVVTHPSQDALSELGVYNWPVWECEVSRFDWEYDQKETCYLVEGDVEVTTDDQTVRIRAGDLVVFPEGLKCFWDVSVPVKKHYRFGD